MSPKYVAGPDIDLDVEVVLDKQGQRITEARARQIATETLEKSGAGRPSLTAPGRRSPEIKARVPDELRTRLQEAARREHTSTSDVIRRALERYLAS
jgi:Arc/MetJ-type ribon-helix-helix transcriptional regulator